MFFFFLVSLSNKTWTDYDSTEKVSHTQEISVAAPVVEPCFCSILTGERAEDLLLAGIRLLPPLLKDLLD